MGQNSAAKIQFQIHPSPLRRPDGRPEIPVAPSGRLPRITQVLALAVQFQEMLRAGEVKDYADLARLGGVTRERISQIMALNWLAPDIQIEILYLPPVPGGRFPISEVDVRKIAAPLLWNEQREDWSKLKISKRLR